MKHYLKHVMLILIITTSMVTSTFEVWSQEESIDDDEVVRTIESLNKIRARYDLPDLSYSNILNKAANLHSKYMDFNDTYSSLEDSSKLYYRGRYPWDRAEYAGYDKTYIFEALMKDVSNYSLGIDFLLENPYSRYYVLDPLYLELGMSKENDYITYLFGGERRNENYSFVYPFDGQQNVDVVFDNKYIQNPYDQVKEDYNLVGVPITYSLYIMDAKILEYSNLDVKLLNKKTNQYIKTKVYTSINDRKLINSIMILPLEQYDYDTTYEISIDADISFSSSVKFETESKKKAVNYKGRFTTVSNTSVTTDVSFLTRQKFIVDLMKQEVSASHYVLKESLEIIFPDVNINDSDYRYLYTAYSNNLIKGYLDGLFRPDANISREQAYTILMRNYISIFGNIKLNEEDKSLQFSDKDSINDWSYDMILAAKKIGLLIDNKYEFQPQEYITISEFNNILSRYVEVSSDIPNIRN